MAYVTKPALIPRDFGFITPVEEKPPAKVTKPKPKKKKVQTKKPKKPTVKKPTKKLGRKLPWKV